MSEPTPPPGYHPFSGDPSTLRFWDGARWHLDAPPPTASSRWGGAPAAADPGTKTGAATWAHLSPLLVMLPGLSVGFTFHPAWVAVLAAWVPPLILRHTGGRRSPLVRAHATESVHFQLSMLIYLLALLPVGWLLMVFTLGLGAIWGFLAGFVWLLLYLAWCLDASRTAHAGHEYRYLHTLRFLH